MTDHLAGLDVRGVHNCKGPFQCRYYPRPDNSSATCIDNECGWGEAFPPRTLP